MGVRVSSSDLTSIQNVVKLWLQIQKPKREKHTHNVLLHTSHFFQIQEKVYLNRIQVLIKPKPRMVDIGTCVRYIHCRPTRPLAGWLHSSSAVCTLLSASLLLLTDGILNKTMGSAFDLRCSHFKIKGSQQFKQSTLTNTARPHKLNHILLLHSLHYFFSFWCPNIIYS